MTTYERAIKQGRWLLARRRILPLAVVIASVAALLLSTPFLLIHGRIWLLAVSLLLAAGGILLRAAAYNQQGKEFDIDRAEGIYSVMRFPFTASNMLLIFSVAVYTGSVPFMIFAAMVCYPATYCVILAQEHTLQSRYGEAFTHWCKRTYAITPMMLNWKPAEHPKPLIKRILMQSRTMFSVVACLAVINFFKNWLVDFRPMPDIPWLAALAVTFVLMTLFPPKKNL